MRYPKVRRRLSHVTLVLTFSLQSYQYELLFCTSDVNDPAIMLVWSLMQKYPSVDASIFVGQ